MENNFSLKDICDLAMDYGIKYIYIFSHKNHDGDAKGSSLALVEYFKNKGFNSKYIITGIDNCLLNVFDYIVEPTESISGDFIAVSVDTSASKNCENTLYLKAKKVFRIDHHNFSERFGDYNLICEEASSTCEIIASMLDEKDITPKMATYLYIGMYTDTGGFRFSISENLFLQLYKLVKCKADTNQLCDNMRYSNSTRKRIEGLVSLKHKSFGPDIIGTIIRNEKSFNALSVARAVSVLTNLKAKIFFCACEDEKGDIYMEIRSSQSSNIDISEYSKKYTGGGGHFHKGSFVLHSIDELYEVINDLKGLL